MGTDELDRNTGADGALDAGVAENLVPTAPGIELPPEDFAVGLYVRKGRRAAASFIFITIALDMLALGMIAPVLPRLIANFTPADDQLLAGVSMKIVGMLVALAAMGVAFYRWFQAGQKRDAAEQADARA